MLVQNVEFLLTYISNHYNRKKQTKFIVCFYH